MRFTQEISIFKPHAIEYAVTSLGTRITQTAAEIRLEAAQTLSNYSTTIQMNSAISQKADQITTEVSQTYATQSSQTAAVNSLSSRITQNANSITSEVTARQNGDNSLSSRITQNANSISSEVTARQNGDNSLSSRINQSAHTITLGVSGKAGKTSGASITISLKDANGNTISSGSGNVLIDGNVIFSSQLTDGTTTISGSNIKTGTIQGASLILGGANNANGTISMRNSSNTEIGTWTNSGLTVTNPNTLQTSLTTDGQLHVYRYNNGWGEMGTLGRYQLSRNGNTYNVIGLNALRENVDGLALVINGNPYYAINASQDPHGGMDFTGYGFRHYFDGDVYCEGTYKTACGYGWGGQGDSDDPIVYTAASVRIENWDGHGHFYAASSIRTDGTCSAGYMWSDGGYGESDRRVKENIVDLDTEKSRKLVMDLKPVRFNYIRTPDKTRHGFIAQDVEKVTDWDLVGENDQGIKGILYTDLIPDLVAVIQEQEHRITELERKNNG